MIEIKYYAELIKAMELVAKEPNAIVLGQTVVYPGSGMYNTLRSIDSNIRHEMPVAENMQLGMSIGLSLQGYLPLSIFPRINFLLSATDQIVHHLDKLSIMSKGEYKPKVIIRTAIGSDYPLDPGLQHKGDTSEGLEKMCQNTKVVRLKHATQIMYEYQMALDRPESTILVEYAELYNT